MNLCCMASWKALRVSCTIGGALQLDHRLLDVGVDAAEHAGQQVVAQQQGLGGDGRAVVVALVQRDHRVGHGDEQRVAGQGRVGGRHRGLLSRPPGGCRARGEGRDPTSDSTHT